MEAHSCRAVGSYCRKLYDPMLVGYEYVAARLLQLYMYSQLQL